MKSVSMNNKRAFEVIEAEKNKCEDAELIEVFTFIQEKLSEDWIPCEQAMPIEHESIFKKFYGTSKWNDLMWCMCSDNVLVSIEYPDGFKKVEIGRTHDGVFYTDPILNKDKKVVAWMPLPKSYGE